MSRKLFREGVSRRGGSPIKKAVALVTSSSLAITALASGVVAGASVANAAEISSAIAAPALSTGAPVVDGRDVGAMMFQWTWTSIAKECTRTLGPAGYGYVQISPPQEHIQGTAWWTSYQPVSYKIESKLGTRAEFKDMVDTCKAAGVGIIADAVINHTTGADMGAGVGVAGTAYSVDNFPGPEGKYGANDFNDCRSNINNYGDRYQVQNCRLVELQDLKTGSDYVRGQIAAYLDDLADLGVAGYRIDAAKHMPAADLEAIKAKTTKAKNLFWVHEVIGAGGEPIQPPEYFGSGNVHEFQYSRVLAGAFQGSISGLNQLQNGLIPSEYAGVFVDNHDTERDNHGSMNYKFGSKYKLANVFMLAYPYGWPTVYSGYLFNGRDDGAPGATANSVEDASCDNGKWTCAHAWPETANMVGFHNAVRGTEVVNWEAANDKAISFGRGDKGQVVINNGDGAISQSFTTSVPDGTYKDVIGGASINVSGGKFQADVPAGTAIAFYKGGNVTPNPTTSPTVNPTTSPTTSPTTNPTAPTSVKVYYSTSNGWTKTNIHYRIDAGTWTVVPGETMTAACEGWVSKEINLQGGKSLEAVFNNGGDVWDYNGGINQNYQFTSPIAAVKDGVVSTTDPCETPATAKDTQAPSVVSGVKATRASATSATLTWKPATDNVGVTAYVITRTGGTGTVTKAIHSGNLSYVSTGMKAGTAYRFIIRARDAAGNVSEGVTINYKDLTSTDKVAPSVPTSLKATSKNTTTAVSWTASTDNVGVVAYDVVRVGTEGTYTRTISATAVNDALLSANTNYTYSIRAIDAAGNKSAYAKVSVKTGAAAKDTTAPTVPGGLKAVSASNTSAQISWSASTDLSGIKHYVVVRTGDGKTTTLEIEGLSFTDTKLTKGTKYTYKVAAVDKAGNKSAYSASQSVSPGVIVKDSTPPSKITDLKATVSGQTVTVTWAASTDDVKVTGYDVVRSGGEGIVSRQVTTTKVSEKLVANTNYIYRVRARDAAGNVTGYASVAVKTKGDTTTPTPTPTATTTPKPTTSPTTTPKPTVSPTVNPGGEGPYYATNPNSQKGKEKTITIDGAFSDWSEDMIIAQGVANDDPRTFRGSHEGPVYDLYSLSAAWDDANLYLMWQMTNVTDVVDPAQGYPISDNGKPYQADIPFQLVFDTDPGKGSDALIEGTKKAGIWGIKNTFSNNVIDKVAMFSAKPGVGQPSIFSLNSSGKFDYVKANVLGFKDAGVEFKYGDGFFGSKMMGVNKSGWGGYTPADLKVAGSYSDFLSLGHSTKQDTAYEMKIPLSALGITKSTLETQGIGAQLVATFGESGIGSLPHDPAMLDAATDPYGPDASSSAEKEDWDDLTVALARIGK